MLSSRLLWLLENPFLIITNVVQLFQVETNQQATTHVFFADSAMIEEVTIDIREVGRTNKLTNHRVVGMNRLGSYRVYVFVDWHTWLGEQCLTVEPDFG